MCHPSGHGFWLHRHLATVGIDNRVVDSSSIEVNRRYEGRRFVDGRPITRGIGKEAA